MKFHHFLAAFHRGLRTSIGAASLLVVSLAMLMTPARAHDLSARVKLYDAAGQRVGMAWLTQQWDGKVGVQVCVHDLPPGFHGFHVHAVGACVPPFTSAKGHFDLDGHTHKDHAGDLPVLQVNADGTAEASFKTDRFEIGDLFDADGSALIIHANPDNYANIPTRYVAAPDATTLATGDAGARIACGVVKSWRQY